MRTVDPTILGAAETILAYFAETDDPPALAVDAVIGFGMFDLSLPRYCADLYVQGAAPRIIFTGGVGAGTGDLGGPEADMWRAEIRRTHPQIPDSAFVLENRSTNTAENIAFTAELLAQKYPALTFGGGIESVIVVASPSRMRRVRLTLRKLQPGVRVVRRLPHVDFAAEAALYARQGVDYFEHLVGELDRIALYPTRGWIAEEPIPPQVQAAGVVIGSWRGSPKR